MKKGIHPKYKETTIVCACGNTVHTHSTKESIHVEICSQCHPFYTGKQKLVDSAGMVERFKNRYAKKKTEKPALAASAEVKPEEQSSPAEVKPEEQSSPAEVKPDVSDTAQSSGEDTQEKEA